MSETTNLRMVVDKCPSLAADKKHAENGKSNDDSDDSDRPKKKAAPKVNGKSKGKA